MIQFVVEILLFFVIFFGIAFILNMLLRKTWLMSYIYPIVVIMIVDDMSTTRYFNDPAESFSSMINKFVNLGIADIVILGSGLVGTIVSGFVIKFLRKSGYQMF
ncbi:YuiB family protein [Virgibacillus ndiopensis]|uniref:YuiB family protein n=1 Tax=Virgibacillus ndiopensis TaxID=2004408 RepID=UPI000C0849FE|nr:YuiB family protein [Virgibacillus ndiopensis]